MRRFDTILEEAIAQIAPTPPKAVAPGLSKYLAAVNAVQSAAVEALNGLQQAIAMAAPGRFEMFNQGITLLVYNSRSRKLAAARGSKTGFDPVSANANKWVIRLDGMNWHVAKPGRVTPARPPITGSYDDVIRLLLGPAETNVNEPGP